MASNPKINFALRGSLIDAQGRRIPNFSCSSPRYIAREINNSLQLLSVAAFEPAFFFEDGAGDGSFLLEPGGTNFLTWNLALNQNVWQKGSNVIVQGDRGPAPDNSFLGDTVTWISGTGATQQLLRTVPNLLAARTYQVTLYLQPTGGRCGANDVIRVTGGVVGGAVSVPLAQLNDFIGKYRVVTLSFTTAGTQPTLPVNASTAGYSVTAVGTNTFTVSGMSGTVANSLVGGQVSFTTSPTLYLITANTAEASGSVTVTVSVATLTANGITTASKATFQGAPSQSCTLELYCESTFSLIWGGAQMEQGFFSTSMIYQQAERTPRAPSVLEFQSRDNPFVGLSSFGLFGELRLWLGDGNLADFGDFRLAIVNGALRVTAGATTLSDPDPLPAPSVKFFVGVSAESGSLSLFVNGVLKARATLNNLKPTAKPLVYTSAGVRLWKTLVCYGQALQDGLPSLGQSAAQEVLALFNSTAPLVNPALIATSTAFNLPTVTIPAPAAATANSAISAINTGTRVVTVGSGTGFTVNDSVAIVRGVTGSANQTVILYATITAVSGANITLDSVSGIVVGDRLVKGNISTPGRAFIRFPFVPIDEQGIIAVDTGNSRVTVTSALAFVINQRTIVRNQFYQDVAELTVTAIDTINNRITLNDVSLLAVGHLISQPASETLIDPQNYTVAPLNQVSGIRVASQNGRARNGIIVENTNPWEVLVTFRIEVFL